jgi:predicted CoA-substrate-specific enzyme activase
MTVAGIDVGSQSTKVVILKDNIILAAVILAAGETAVTDAQQAMEEALRKARLRLQDMENVVSTGAGRMSVPFARKQRSTESCLGRGAHFLFPQALTVLDAGGSSSTAIRLSADGMMEDSANNDKCAACSGMFLETASRMLRIPLAELGAESLKATKVETISSTCAVFAESEVISLVHRDPPVPIPNILAGLHKSMADKLFGLVQRVGKPSELLMTGGVSKNIGVIRAMEAKLGKQVLVPEEPRIVEALGAALIAQQDLANQEIKASSNRQESAADTI